MKIIENDEYIDNMMVPMAAKYLLPAKVADLRKQFHETSDWFTAYERRKLFNLSSVGLININLGRPYTIKFSQNLQTLG